MGVQARKLAWTTGAARCTNKLQLGAPLAPSGLRWPLIRGDKFEGSNCAAGERASERKEINPISQCGLAQRARPVWRGRRDDKATHNNECSGGRAHPSASSAPRVWLSSATCCSPR